MKIFWLIATMPIAVFLYVGYVFLAAYVEVKGLPRGETFICDKHGPMQKETTITFVGVPYCSLCFHERLKSAEQIPGINGRVQ